MSLPRRFLVFGLFGPPIGLAALLVGMPVLLGLAPSEAYNGEYMLGALPVFLLLAFFLGEIPALLAAIVDHGLDRAGLRPLPRAGAMAAAGGLLCLLPVREAIAMGYISTLGAGIFSVSGLAAAAACSAIASRWGRAGPAPHS